MLWIYFREKTRLICKTIKTFHVWNLTQFKGAFIMKGKVQNFLFVWTQYCHEEKVTQRLRINPSFLKKIFLNPSFLVGGSRTPGPAPFPAHLLKCTIKLLTMMQGEKSMQHVTRSHLYIFTLEFEFLISPGCWPPALMWCYLSQDRSFNLNIKTVTRTLSSIWKKEGEKITIISNSLSQNNADKLVCAFITSRLEW